MQTNRGVVNIVVLKLIFLVIIMSSCKVNTQEEKEALKKEINAFVLYKNDSAFTSYVFGGQPRDVAKDDWNESIRFRLGLNLKNIAHGVNGFQFGFHFKINESSYYIDVMNDNDKLKAKLFENKFVYIGPFHPNSLRSSEFFYKKIHVKSLTLYPKSGWISFLNNLNQLGAHKVLNEYDSTLQQYQRFVIIEQNSSFIIEFANKNNYRISEWLMVEHNPNFKERVLVDNIIKLLYKEFNLGKYISEMKQYPY